MMERVRLKDVAEIVTGSTPATNTPAFFGGDIPFVTPPELNGANPIVAAPTTLSSQGAAQVRVVPKDAVLVCCIGSLGKIGIAGVPLATNQQINAVVFDDSKVFPRYGLHCCCLLKPVLERMAPATTVKIVNKSRFSDLTIPLPPLPEQRRIAAILDKADELRAKRRAALEQLNGLMQAVFVEMFGDPITNPKRFDKKPLGSLASKIGSGATPLGGDAAYKAEGIALIRSMNVRNGVFLRKDLARIDERQAAKLSNVEVLANDVLLNITGASVARVCRVPADILPARVNQHVSIIRTGGLLSPVFLERMLLFPSMKEKLLRLGDSGGATRQAITKGQLEALDVILPSVADQRRFAERQSLVEKVCREQDEFAANADSLFSSVQHRAFSGEL